MPSIVNPEQCHIVVFIHKNVVDEIGPVQQAAQIELIPRSTAFVDHRRPIPPTSVELQQNYPNPFNSSTTIRFTLRQPAYTTFKIYNIAGQEIETLINGHIFAGKHSVSWQAKELPSGIYLARLQTEGQIKTMKLVFQK